MLIFANAQTRFITTVAGTGTCEALATTTIDNAAALATPLHAPSDILLHGQIMYIAEMNGNRIRQWNMTSGIMSILVGKSGVASYTGDEGNALQATLNAPTGLALDGKNNLLYIVDRNNMHIRRVNLTSNIISTIGPTLFFPSRAVLDPASNVLYVAEEANNRVMALNVQTGQAEVYFGMFILIFNILKALARQFPLVTMDTTRWHRQTDPMM